MGSYLYRRPDNYDAADYFEKVGCFLMSGLDCFTEELVTYHNQTIITHYKPTDRLLPEIIRKIWNVVKLIFAPFSIIGICVLYCSNSYAQFKANIGDKGANIIQSDDDFASRVWRDVHGADEPFDKAIVGDQHIWDYAVQARKNYLGKVLDTPTTDMSVNRESGRIKAKTVKPDVKAKYNIALNNIPVDRPGTEIRPLTSIDTIQTNLFNGQFGSNSRLIRPSSSSGDNSQIQAELKNNPHRVLLQTNPTAKKVNVAYQDKDGQFVNKEISGATPALVKAEISIIRGLTKYAADVEAAKVALDAEVRVKREELATGGHVGVTINAITYQYEFVSEDSGARVIHRYPLYLGVKEVLNKIMLAGNSFIDEPSLGASSSVPEEVFVVSESFLRAKPTTLRTAPQCNVADLTNTVMELNTLIAEDHPHRHFYLVALDNLYRMLTENPTENWGVFAQMLNRPERHPMGPFTAGELLFILENIAGKNVEGVLYYLHKTIKEQTTPHDPSFSGILFDLRNIAFDRFIQDKAVQYDCSEEDIRRELVRLGVGIDYPVIQRPMSPLPEAMKDVNLLEALQLWMTPEQLHMNMKVSFQPEHLRELENMINPYLEQKAYKDKIDADRAKLTSPAMQMAFASAQFHPMVERERLAIEKFKNVDPVKDAELSVYADRIVKSLRVNINNLKANTLNRAKNPEQLTKYLEDKKVLVETALEQHRQALDYQRQQVRNGALSSEYFNRMKVSILQREGYVHKGMYTTKCIKDYLTSLALK